MRSLPRNAQCLVAATWLLGAGALVGVGLSFHRLHPSQWELLFLMLLGAASGRAKLRIIRFSGPQDSSIISLGFALIFVTLLLFGPAAAVFVGLMSTLVSCLFPKRQPLYQFAFNVALNVFVTWTSGLLFLIVNGNVLALTPLRSFPAVLLSCLWFFLLDTGAVATVVALSTGQDPWRLWREKFLWTAPSYFASACVAALAILILGRHLGVVLLYVSPVAFLTYQAYRLYTDRAEERQRHIDSLEVGKAQLTDLYLATIKSLALAIDAKDPFTHQHILRVQRYAVAIARQMGVGGAELEGIETGAVLHDIGKLGVPDYVLLKPGRLTPEEFEKIKKHPEIGAAILEPVKFPWPVVPAVKFHHERWDGTGYPDGLSGEAIPLPGRILAVADVYDALTSSRSYRSAWPSEKALTLIRDGAGTHFDSAVVAAFLDIVEDISRELAQENIRPPEATLIAAKGSAHTSREAAREIHRASSELLALYEVAQTLGTSLGLQETLDILARKMETILPGTACLFLLKEETGEALAAHAAVGLNRTFFADSRTSGPGSRSWQAASSGVSYVGPYDAEDLRMDGSASAPWTDLQSALIAPMAHRDAVIGTINLYHPQLEAFGVQDRQFLEIIAAQAALAIGNALLFDRTRSSALTDPLTGLYNVRHIMQEVDSRCRAGEGEKPQRKTDPFALLCLDLDSFKPINDLFGHQKGDQVLRGLGEIFCANVRKDDVVGRYGGDEFLIVLSMTTTAEAEVVAQKIEEGVAEYDPGLSQAGLGDLRLGVSIGISSFPDDGTNGASLLSAADARMYRRKAERKLRRLAG